MLHALLLRQLRKLGLDRPDESPDEPAWRELLETVSRTYKQADQDRYLLERSLTISSREMRDLYATLRRRTESRIALERDKLEAVISALGAGVCTLDREGRLISVNPEGERLLGWSEADLSGRPFPEVVASEEAVEVRQRLGEPMQSGRRVGNAEFTRRDGSTLPVSYVLNPLHGEETPGAVLVFLDMREQRFMEEALLEAKELAEAASVAKSTFLANMSHEIRTPLNAILGMTGLLLDAELSPELRDRIETIRVSSESLLTLISEVLDLSKIESGHVALVEKPFNVRRCLEGSIDLVTGEAAAKGLEITHTLHGSVPDTVVGDDSRVRQVLVNLLTNAVRFTEKGGIAVTVSAQRRKDSALELSIAVRDSGVGIAPHEMDHLFEPFRQGDNPTTRDYSGTGLGLAICKHLTGVMGGWIRVESVEGEGSTFTFAVPVGRVDREADRAAEQEVRSPPPQLNQELARQVPLRILVAEDQPINQKVVLLMLERMGYRPDLAADGVEVLEAVERRPYDLILMDVQMPEMDGLEAARRIRERLGDGNGPRIVAVTAGALRGDRERCLAAGMDDYLSKPIRIEDLQALLASQRPARRPPVGEAPGELRGENPSRA